MAYLLVRHKVTDFAKWKPIFDAHESARVAAGLNAKQILRGIDNPNEVMILFEASDVAKARTLVSSPGLKAVMQAAGIIDKPDLYFLQ